MLKRDPSYEREIRLWVILGVVVVLVRFAVRNKTYGFSLKGDDYAMMVTCILWVSSFVVLDIIYQCGTNLDLEPAQIQALSDDEIVRVIRGSKFQQVAWYLYPTMLWSMKCGVLLFYKRLTLDLWRDFRIFKYLVWFTALSYVSVIGTVTFSCLPYQNNWGVRPLSNDRCLHKTQNLLVTTFFNVITDVAILSLPIPTLGKMRVSVYKKILIMVLVCSGIYFIAAAIMRVVVTLNGERSTIVVNLWGTRELGVGLVATNAPSLRPLVSRKFWQRNNGSPPRNQE
ncbi:uncharacterized protein LY79DRAFT_531647, partial [Colletotrichum navitas]